MSTLFRGVTYALVCALVASVTVLAVPAQAEVTVTMDRNLEDKRTFKKVTLSHGEKQLRFRSRVFKPKGIPDWVYHQVDTRGGPRPEFVVSVIVKVDVGKRPRVNVYRNDAWLPRENPWQDLDQDERVDCGLTVGAKLDRKRVLRVVTGRGCFRTNGEMPTRVRVNTLGGYVETPDAGTPHIYDPVPARRKHGAWTSAG